MTEFNDYVIALNLDLSLGLRAYHAKDANGVNQDNWLKVNLVSGYKIDLIISESLKSVKFILTKDDQFISRCLVKSYASLIKHSRNAVKQADLENDAALDQFLDDLAVLLS